MYEYVLETLIGLCLVIFGWVGRSVNFIQGQTQDLHDWHKPNAEGIQTWKGNPEAIDKLVDKIDNLTDSVKEFLVEIRARNR